jgi:prephenate dehydrogenase
MWEGVGSRVMSMEAQAHDRLLAAVSHLPHMIAYTLVNTVAGSGGDGLDDILGFSAGGFKDFTRIASSSPEMWADICSANSAPIVEMINAFLKRLERLKHLIKADDRAGVLREFEKAKRLRDTLVKPPKGV